jgi:hypothetical protein
MCTNNYQNTEQKLETYILTILSRDAVTTDEVSDWRLDLLTT